MIIFCTEKTCNTLLAPIQYQDNISSYILYLVGHIFHSKTNKYDIHQEGLICHLHSFVPSLSLDHWMNSGGATTGSTNESMM